MTSGRVTKLERCHDGPLGRPYWTARLTIDGHTYEVHNRLGVWAIGDGRRHLLPAYAALMQAKVRPLEARERRAAATRPGGVLAV